MKQDKNERPPVLPFQRVSVDASILAPWSLYRYNAIFLVINVQLVDQKMIEVRLVAAFIASCTRKKRVISWEKTPS